MSNEPLQDFDPHVVATRVAKAAVASPIAKSAAPPTPVAEAVRSAISEQMDFLYRALDGITVRLDTVDALGN